MRKRDEPAFPAMTPEISFQGLTKLEYTAIQALQGLLATGEYVPGARKSMGAIPDEKKAAHYAITAANALWDELEKEPGK